MARVTWTTVKTALPSCIFNKEVQPGSRDTSRITEACIGQRALISPSMNEYSLSSRAAIQTVDATRTAVDLVVQRPVVVIITLLKVIM
jgi:hypothetical protein